MQTWLWALILAAAIWGTHWGAERIAEPFRKLRRQLGLTEIAGAAFVGLAAAGPEVGINAVSAIREVSEIGLGTMLSSNILAIPLIISTTYWASRRSCSRNPAQKDEEETLAEHERHCREHLLAVKKDAVGIQAVPYLFILALVAILTLPRPWRGLQPIDGWIMVAAYLVYLSQALWRGRQAREHTRWGLKELCFAGLGVLMLATGAFLAVRATEHIIGAFGISKLAGGLFITGPMAVLPELFAAWSVARSGQMTSAIGSVIGDHTVTMTIAFLPLALVTTPVGNLSIFAINFVFVAIMPALYAGFIQWGWREPGFKLWQILVLLGVYLLYLATMALLGSS